MKILISKSRVFLTLTGEPTTESDAFPGDYVDLEVYWTDETSSNRHGIGTISIGGVDHGPSDRLPGDKTGRTIADLVCSSYAWGRRYNVNGFYSFDEIEKLRMFCAQWPEGPQFPTEKL